MKALLTGASGFVGGAVLRSLVRQGLELRVMVRPGTDTRYCERLGVEAVAGDLRDAASLRAAVSGCQALFHVAADYRLWVPDPASMYATNVDGTAALMRAALDAGLERIVYTSSVAVLGVRSDGHPADEETPSTVADMVGHYKRSKFLAEEAVRRMCREQGLPAVIVNPSTPVGPGDRRPTPTGRMVRDAAAGRMPAYVDTGLNIVHVDDVAQGHWLAFQHGKTGERYILGGDNLSLERILTRIAEIAGHAPPRLRLPRPALYPVAVAAEAWQRLRGGGTPLVTVDELRMAAKKMFFSSAKAERDLGYTHRPAEAAFADAVHWFQERGVPGRMEESRV
jgi:dihydroflavonol-4-reductase